MNLTIHRGTNEIGGSCIELQSENSRILVDFGMPLLDSNGKALSFRDYEKLSVNELVAKNILPNVKDAYSENSKIDGLVISHSHGDHYGLMHYLDKNIPVWIGEATYEILKLNNIFLNQKNEIENPNYFERWRKFQIGDFTITPFWNDHSAFDAYSMWSGYKEQPKTKEFMDYFRSQNFKIIDIHTSGHADVETLKKYASVISPKIIIPIHTNNKKDYKSIFGQTVLELEDNEMYEIK